MTEANWNHLIDAATSTLQYLLGPLVIAVATCLVVWWRAKVAASVLAKKVEDTASALAARTAAVTYEQTETLTAQQAGVLDKIDDNTKITSQIADQTNGAMDAQLNRLNDHGQRIQSLEGKAEGLKSAVDSLNANLVSTRHEIRSQLQVIMNNQMIAAGRPPSAEKKDHE